MFLKTEERPQGEVQQGTLKLSEAVRAGAKMGPQGVLWSDDSPCALCGALWAIGEWDGKGMAPWYKIRKIWPHISKQLVEKIEEKNGFTKVNQSREQIADWLQEMGL